MFDVIEFQNKYLRFLCLCFAFLDINEISCSTFRNFRISKFNVCS